MTNGSDRPQPGGRDGGHVATGSGQAAAIDPDTGEPILSVEEALEMAGEEELRRYRKLGPGWTLTLQAVAVISTFLVVNQMFNLGLFVGHVILETRYLYLIAALLLPFVFIFFPIQENRAEDKVPWFDYIMAALTFGLILYFAWFAEEILDRGWEYAAPTHAIVASVMLWPLLLEAGRRTGGNVVFFMALIPSLYPVFAHLMPEPLTGVNQDIWTTAGFHMMSVESLIGAPFQAFALLVFGFLVFGAAMQYTGAGVFFINVAFALLGHVRGGSAKVAIFASALFGSMSGSVTSNVLTTGSMTIPAMKKAGFSPTHAASIEACASTGGALMPPVMGATAFVMASFLGVPYAEVALAAAVPSILYYFGLFMQIDAYAGKHRLHGIPRSELPGLWQTVKDGWYYCLAFGTLLWMLLVLQREQTAPFYATVILIVINQFSGKYRMTWETVGKFISGCGLLFVELAGFLAPIGLVIGGLTVTGMVGTLTNDLVFLAGGSTLMLLIMGAVTSFILGLGLTTTACYIFLAVILAPALEKAGLDRVAVHLFLLYWGTISFITPPVAIASTVAAGLAQAPQWRTGIESMKFGIILYFVPFFFVYNSALLLSAPVGEILLVTVTAVIGIIFIAGALQDYLIGFGVLGSGPLGWTGRTLIVIGGLFMAAPSGTVGLGFFELLVASLATTAAGLLACYFARRISPPRIART
jgi:TRAP transporter 4TM/12TM fusion protein